jgi:hypothetical protein
MKTKNQEPPAQVADECEMLATQFIDDNDREVAALFMHSAHGIRRALRTLERLNNRVHSGYDFNADPDRMTLEVGEVLKGYVAPSNNRDVGRAEIAPTQKDQP